MTFDNKIQNFLQEKLKEHNLKRKDFAQKSGIPYTTVNKMINAVQANPEIKTILKIANYFNCSIDEILKREDNYTLLENKKFNNVSIEQINFNLRNFVSEKLEKNKLTIYKLGKNIGFSELAIFGFMKGTNIKKTLGSVIIIAIADYFKVSIDEMIGRISPSNQESQTLEKTE